MILVEAEALVTYSCVLDDANEEILRDYVEEHGCSFDEALQKLFWDGDLDVYQGYQTESDCSTQEVNFIKEEQ